MNSSIPVPVNMPKDQRDQPENKEIKPGSIVYSREGFKAEYLCNSSGGHVVKPCVIVCGYGDGTEEEERFEGATIWYEVFEKPPVNVLNEEVVRLNKVIQEKRAEVAAILSEKREAEADIKNRAERLKRHKQLELLDEFLAGKITHYLEIGRYQDINVYPITEMKDKSPYSDGKVKLLVLFGRSNGDLSWELSQYSDGSGIYREILCFTSESAAIQKAKELVLENVKKWQADNKSVWLSSIIDCADRFKVDIPKELRLVRLQSILKTAESELTNAKKQLELKEESFQKARLEVEKLEKV